MGTRVVAGCMTGTSLDGIDAALVEIRGRGLAMEASVRAVASGSFGDLATPLRALASGEPATAAEVSQAAHAFGHAVADVLVQLPAASLDLCAVHGQTVYHAPPMSWQLINPWVIADRLGCDVVYDLRGADLAAGGQGAPITPLADAVLFVSEIEERVILNLGGFCNASVLPAGDRTRARGADVCACNQVLDEVARTALGKPYDSNGEAAERGRINTRAQHSLATVLERQTNGGRSLGTGDEAGAWVREWRAELSADDLAATAAAAVGGAIRAWLETHAPGARPFVAGGGAKNAALVRAIGARETTEQLGVSPEAREAVAMAVLGALAQDGVPITLAHVTGRRESRVVDGAWIRTRARA